MGKMAKVQFVWNLCQGNRDVCIHYDVSLPQRIIDWFFFNFIAKLVKLSNGTAKNNGRIEVYHNEQWGSICHRGWDINDAHVVCRMLGFQGATAAIPRSFYGAGDLNISLTNVQCSGDESMVHLCPHDGWGNHGCTADEIAGVSCHVDGTGIELSCLSHISSLFRQRKVKSFPASFKLGKGRAIA